MFYTLMLFEVLLADKISILLRRQEARSRPGPTARGTAPAFDAFVVDQSSGIGHQLPTLRLIFGLGTRDRPFHQSGKLPHSLTRKGKPGSESCGFQSFAGICTGFCRRWSNYVFPAPSSSPGDRDQRKEGRSCFRRRVANIASSTAGFMRRFCRRAIHKCFPVPKVLPISLLLSIVKDRVVSRGNAWARPCCHALGCIPQAPGHEEYRRNEWSLSQPG